MTDLVSFPTFEGRKKVLTSWPAPPHSQGFQGQSWGIRL